MSNDLKKKMSAKEKGQFKDNGWFVGVSPRRNPEIVVACLFEGGEHGALAAVVATKVIAAYVQKQRTRQTLVAKGGAQPEAGKAEVAAVWHEGDTNTSGPPADKLGAGHFNIDATGKIKPVAAAPGMATAKPAEARELQTTESHTEMAEPESDSGAQPAQPSLRSEGEQPAPEPNQKKAAPKPQSAPPTAPAQPAAGPVAPPTAELIQENHP